jgi:uncharacterized Zn finger protein
MEKSTMTLLGLQRATEEKLKIKKRGDVFRVTNSEGNQVYSVHTSGNVIQSCTCPHHVNRNVICKHMFYVMMKSKNQYTLKIV